ncbi:hypothetical protein [Bacillus cereus group sp. BfR-BA-01492]|uniref:hypothetical protein n=1 Tax=Bacillus cereus group sp. BfR-BA-01492 TaxID=2920361 RepID=UPI0037BE63D4
MIIVRALHKKNEEAFDASKIWREDLRIVISFYIDVKNKKWYEKMSFLTQDYSSSKGEERNLSSASNWLKVVNEKGDSS